MNPPTPAQTGTLTATWVSDAQRIHFWPKYFGQVPKWALIEPQVFRWLDRLCEDYHGDFWDFYTLPNGGYHCLPDGLQPLCPQHRERDHDRTRLLATGIRTAPPRKPRHFRPD
ncbi:antirestriction ArdB family protein [Yersinia frederiksenii]|nr:antirestriction ArdB family protein [Yersinia frederiksenii]